MAQTTMLPDELVEEILLRVPPDEPKHLVHATLVCKTWHSILSGDTFRRRYHMFHKTPTLQGYFYDDFTDSTFRFVPTTSMAGSTSFTPKINDNGSRRASVLDCRHGRVLISRTEGSTERLIVWDLIGGIQQHLSLPAYPQHPYLHNYNYAAAVLCAKNDDCDHLDCHDGSFVVVLLASSHDYDYYGQYVDTWATVYSSESGAWSASMTPNVRTRKHIDMTPGLLIGDALYFNTILRGYSIVKYDLCKHELSVIRLPGDFVPILIKGTDGGLGLATLFHNCIYSSSWQVDNNGGSGSLKYRILELDDTLLLRDDHSTDLIGTAEGTNTVFIQLKDIGLYTLDLKSRHVRKIGKKETSDVRHIFPYMSFYTPRYLPCTLIF